MAGDFDTFIASRTEIFAPPPDSDTQTSTTPTSNRDWDHELKVARETEKERIEFAKAVQGTSQRVRDLASQVVQDKAAHLKCFEDAKKAIHPYQLGLSDEQFARIPLFISLPEPYPPCLKPLDSLKEIYLKDLLLETHHRGKFVVVQVITELVFQRTGILAVVEDGNGETDYLVFDHGQSQLGGEMLPKGSHIAIKEPYYTANRSKASWNIQVDHPSDLVHLLQSSPRLPPTFRMQALAIHEKTAEDWKADGNKAIKLDTPAGYHQAVVYYSEGLNAVKDHEAELKLDLLRNRALASLELGHYDAAFTDALAAVSGPEIPLKDRLKDLNYKSYRRAAWAKYKLRRWTESQDLLKTCLQLRPKGDNADVKQLLARVSARLREENTGKYDFTSIIRGLDARPRVDAGDFLKRTEVKASPGKGRGLFATGDIDLGDIILVEKAAHIMWETDKDFFMAINYTGYSEELWKDQCALLHSIVRELDRNPSWLPEMLDLFYDDYPKDPGIGKVVDGKAIIDVFHMRKLMCHNLYTCATPSASQDKKIYGFSCYAGIQNAGVWPRANMMNHACVPNVSISKIGDLLVLRARQVIRKGDELFSGYRDDFEFERRQEVLKMRWGFECSCPVCTAERSLSKEVRDRRKELLAKYKKLTGASQIGLADPETLNKNSQAAFELYTEIVETYELKFKGMPRNQCINIMFDFLNSWWTFRPAREVYAFVNGLCLDMGCYIIDLDEEEPKLTMGKNGLLDPRTVTALLIAAKVEEQQGKQRAKTVLEGFAAEVYRIVNGVDGGFQLIRDGINKQGKERISNLQ